MPSTTMRRELRIAAFIAFGLYAAFICLHVSARRMMFADELNAWNLLADPSWHHAFASLTQGADSGTPLFYAIGRIILAITGLHPVAMRLYSALCFFLAAIIWEQILRRYFGDFIAFAAVFLVFLCSTEVLNEIPQVRFYGQLMFGAAVAVAIAVWLHNREHPTVLWFLLSALGGLLLVSAHPLGITYSAAILVGQLCTKSPIRKRIAVLIGTVLSWSYLLLFLGPVKNAAYQDTWLRAPGPSAVLHFYDNTPLLFSHYRYVSVLVNVLLLALAAYAIVWFFRSRKNLPSGSFASLQSTSFTALFYIALLIALEPIGFAILSHLYRPVFLGRYLLPYSLGLITLAAAGAWLVTQRIDPRYLRIGAPIIAVALLPIPYLLLPEQYQNPVSSLDSILQASQSMPTVVAEDALVRQAHFYAPDKAKNIVYVLTPAKPGESNILQIMSDRGYAPSFVFDQPFLHDHPQFLYIADGWNPPFYTQDIQGNNQWSSRQIGTVTMHGQTVPLLEFTRIDSTPAR